VLLIPELLTKPMRDGADTELDALAALLARLELRPTDRATAELAVVLGASYRLGAADAVHLATAVAAGADRFITNNKSSFAETISEIDITYPLRSIVPDAFEDQVKLADVLTDGEFLDLCFSESFRDRHRRSRTASGARWSVSGPRRCASGQGRTWVSFR
jgi:hypothetical protein